MTFEWSKKLTPDKVFRLWHELGFRLFLLWQPQTPSKFRPKNLWYTGTLMTALPPNNQNKNDCNRNYGVQKRLRRNTENVSFDTYDCQGAMKDS